MSDAIREPEALLPRELVAERLAVPAGVLIRYETRGLVRSVRRGAVEGYEPAEIRRIWSVVSLHRDLGINLAGVEAIVQLRSQLDQVHAQMAALAARMQELVDEGTADDRA